VRVQLMISERLKSKTTFGFLLVCVLAVLIFLEFLTFVCWLLLGFLGANDIYAGLLNLESCFFYASSSLAPLFTSLLMFSWLPILAFTSFLKGRFKQSLNPKAAFPDKVSIFARLTLERAVKPTPLDRHCGFIAVFSLLSILLTTTYPYLPALNPSGKFVGVDIPFYEKALVELRGLGSFQDVVSAAFVHYQDRPLSILLLFFMWRLTWLSPLEAAQFSPVILGLTLVLCTFLFARLFRFNMFSASLTMLFTSFSFHVTVGMYGGFVANWVAVIFLYGFWGFTFAALKKGAWSCLTPTVALQGLLFFSHANTWAMCMGVVLVLLLLFLLERISKGGDGFKCQILFTILFCGVLLNTVRNSLLNVSLERVEAAEVAKTGISLENLQMFWHILNVSLFSYKGTSFMNPPLLALAFIGSLTIYFNDDKASKIFKAFIIASTFPFVLGDQVIQTRILYNLPLQIFALIGLYALQAAVEFCFEREEAAKLNKLLFLLVVFVNLNYALRCSFNLTAINFFPG